MEHSTYIDSLPESSIGRYNEKLSLVGLEKCPNEMIEDVWSIDPSRWSQMQYHDLYHYLIKSPGKLKEYL
jgi:hypothetical protein